MRARMPIELARAVRRLAEKDDARVGDALDQRVDETPSRCRRCGSAVSRTSVGQTRGLAGPPRRPDDVAPLLGPTPAAPMSGTNRTSARASSRYSRLALARDRVRAPATTRRRRPGSRADRRSRAGRAARGGLRPARRHGDRVVRCVLRPAERAVAASDVDVGDSRGARAVRAADLARDANALDGVDLPAMRLRMAAA